MKIFCLWNKLSDKSASDLNKLINTIVDNNNLPSNYAFAENIKKLPNEKRIDTQVIGGHTRIMSFGHDLAQIVSRNWETILSYSNLVELFIKTFDFTLKKSKLIQSKS